MTLLPFDVVEDYSKSYSELQDIGMGGGEVGLVRTVISVVQNGCSASVGYKEPTLFVATELKRDSCAFEHVREHELEHVRIYRAQLVGMRARIEERVAHGQPLFAASSDKVLSVLPKHAAFDNPDEYRKNKTDCNGKIVKLALNR